MPYSSNLARQNIEISFLLYQNRYILFKAQVSLVDPFYPYHTTLHLKRDFCTSSLSKAFVSYLLIRCCDDSIVNSNENKHNAASNGRTRFQSRNFLRR